MKKKEENLNVSHSAQDESTATVVEHTSVAATKICGNCKAEIEGKTNFCPKCGKAYMPLLCDKCHHVATTAGKFCLACGKRIKSKQEKKKKRIRLAILGVVALLVLGLTISDIIRENKAVAEVKVQIDAIGEDYSAFYEEDLDARFALGEKISNAYYAFERLGEGWGTSAINKLEKSGHLAHLYEAKDELRRKEMLEDRIKQLGEDLKSDAAFVAKYTLKTPSSFEEISSYTDTIYEYNGKLYGGCYISYSGTNGFGGREDYSLHLYFAFDGKFEDVSVLAGGYIDSVFWKNASKVEYETAKTNGTSVHHIRLEE